MLPPVSIELLDFWLQHSPVWTNLAFACVTEILGYLYSCCIDSKIKWYMNRRLKISCGVHAIIAQKGECWTRNQSRVGFFYISEFYLMVLLDIKETASTLLFAQASFSSKNGSEIATFCLLRTKPLLRSLLIMPTIINFSFGQLTIANVLVNEPHNIPYDLSIDSGQCEQIWFGKLLDD